MRSTDDSTTKFAMDSGDDAGTPPVARPSWEQSAYPRDATGVGNTPPPPFARDESSDNHQHGRGGESSKYYNPTQDTGRNRDAFDASHEVENDVATTPDPETHEQTGGDAYDSNFFHSDDRTTNVLVDANRVVANSVTEEAATEGSATEEAATEKPATEKPATEEAATEEAATEEAATEEAATEEAATEEAASEESGSEKSPSRYGEADDGDDLLPAPRSSHIAFDESDSDQSSSEDSGSEKISGSQKISGSADNSSAGLSNSDDLLPPPRPRLTIGEDTLPAPRGDSRWDDGLRGNGLRGSGRASRGASEIADDGFRSRPGQSVTPKDSAPDDTIRPPVTRLVRLGPPDPDSAPIRAPQFHTIRDGDTLDRLAERYWGDASRWRAIYSANRHVIADPELLPIGAKLKIPNDDFYQTLRRK